MNGQEPVAVFDFNRGSGGDREDSASQKVLIRGALMSEDRFGNEDNALYFHGNEHSYANLGPSQILNRSSGAISLWFNMHGIMGTGTGVESNPIFSARSHGGDDCNDAIYIGVDMNTKRVNGSTLNSAMEGVSIYSQHPIRMARWHHVVLNYTDSFLELFFDGRLEYRARKNFRTRFLEGDSLLIGNRAGKKNQRYFLGSIDDIQIYNRPLKRWEVQDLYKAPDPDQTAKSMRVFLAFLAAISAIVVIVILFRMRLRQLVEKERKKNILRYKWLEQENKVLSAQMDPHFIFNSLNTIQQLIVINENEKAQIYLSKFSKLIRKMLETNTREHITLTEEIGICRNYLEIESLRFNKIFSYRIEFDASLNSDDIIIPHFMIQPLIENALWHGLLPKEGEKTLLVKFNVLSDSVLECRIEDNGIGRDAAKRAVKRRQSLATSLIEQRLQTFSSLQEETYTMKVIDKRGKSGLPEGTLVLITLPVLKSEKHVESYNY